MATPQSQTTNNPPPATPKEAAPIVLEDKVDWQWPTKGKLENLFNEAQGQKGIDILGSLGQEIKLRILVWVFIPNMVMEESIFRPLQI